MDGWGLTALSVQIGHGHSKYHHSIERIGLPIDVL